MSKLTMPDDIRAEMISVKSKKEPDYLPAHSRIKWFRRDYPTAGIVTQIVEGGLEAGFAVVSASVTLEDGRMVCGMKSESRKGFPDFIEKAETGAISRALSHLGYGTGADFDTEAELVRPADSPKRVAAPDAPGTSSVFPGLDAWIQAYKEQGGPLSIQYNLWLLGELIGAIRKEGHVTFPSHEYISDDDYIQAAKVLPSYVARRIKAKGLKLGEEADVFAAEYATSPENSEEKEEGA